jgi:hypothetical protein
VDDKTKKEFEFQRFLISNLEKKIDRIHVMLEYLVTLNKIRIPWNERFFPLTKNTYINDQHNHAFKTYKSNVRWDIMEDQEDPSLDFPTPLDE